MKSEKKTTQPADDKTKLASFSFNETFFQALIENSWDGIALFGADGTILYGSSSTVQILGYSLNEFVGRNAFELIHEEDQASVTESLTLSLNQPRTHIPVYARVRHKNGEWRWLEGIFTNLLDEPNVQAIVNNYHDFTERKKIEAEFSKLNTELEQRVEERTLTLRKSEEQYRTLYDSIDEGFCIIEMIFDEREKPVDYRFLSVNPAFEKQTGLVDAPGKTMRWFAPNHEEHWFEIYGRIALTGEPARFVNQAEQLNRWYDVYAFRYGKAEKRQVAILFNDITNRRDSEAEIQRLNKDLQQHTAQLEAANKELEAFSYSVSHDLRAPLRTIDGFSQALLEDYETQLPEEAQGYLTRIRSAAQRMAELIDDLLNLSRVTRSVMKFVPVDLSKIVQGIATELQNTHRERNVNIIIAPNLKAQGDPGLLQAVFENLINNAWKFTSKQEQAEIEFGSKDENSETVYFIRDNGAGFDMTYANKLFGAFQRLHSMTDFPGTGIGLATVQRIIHRHGERIWAEAEVGQGATFFFTLPALERAKQKTVTEEKEATLAERVKEII